MLVVYYLGSRHEYFEEKTTELVSSFKGKVTKSFDIDQGQWSLMASFPSKDQEDRFKEHILELSRHLKISASFGGVVEL